MVKPINEAARKRILNENIPDSLLIPVAANNKESIEMYVGDIVSELSRSGTEKAFLVRVEPAVEIDRALKIWDDPESGALFEELQVWVNVDYTGYRDAYKRAFNDKNIDGLVLSHCRGRPIVRMLEYEYVRISPARKRANSSSVLSEVWGCDIWKNYDDNGNVLPTGRSKHLLRFLDNKPDILYADTTEILLLLNKMIGGGIMKSAYYAEELFRPRDAAPLFGIAENLADVNGPIKYPKKPKKPKDPKDPKHPREPTK